MRRLGELLVAAGLLTPEQVEQALRAQVLWGGRLGTNLVELHHLELDPLSKALGRQHRLPAALARHFEKADPELQRRLPPELADRFSCLPLVEMGPGHHVVIAALAPLPPRPLAIIADELGVEVRRLVLAIAAELRIRYQLERVYQIRRTARFLRARGNTLSPFPAFPVLPVQAESEAEPEAEPPSPPRELAMSRPPPEPPAEPPPSASAAPTAAAAVPADSDLLPIEVAAPTAEDAEDAEDAEEAEGTDDAADLDDLSPAALDDDLAIPTGPAEDEARARERRHYVRTIADAPPSDPERQALLGRIAIRKVAVGSAPRIMAGATLVEATRAIRRSTGRDRVAELVIDALDRFAPACEAAILLVVRGATAIGWKGFQRAGSGLGEIAVPMDGGGLVPQAVELSATLRRTADQLDAIDRLLLASLGRDDGALVVVPISIADQVMCAIAIAAAEDAPLPCVETIAAAAGAAFARLMRDTGR